MQKPSFSQRILSLLQSFWLGLQSLWLRLFSRQSISNYGSTFTFLKNLVNDPKSVGAVLPSSKWLAKAMVSHVKISPGGMIVELGAGTGVITQALLKSGVSPKKIIAIESAKNLAKDLQAKLPDIQVIDGDAANLNDLLSASNVRIDTVISSLPLRSLPEKTVQSVLSQIPLVLSDKGHFIQFTYDLRNDVDYYPENYHLQHSRIVWWNIPPAKVEVFSIR